MEPGSISQIIRDTPARGWPAYREREARWSTSPAPWSAACCSASRQTAAGSWSGTGPRLRTRKEPCGSCRRAAAPQSGWTTSSPRMPPGHPTAGPSSTPWVRSCTWPVVTEGRHGGSPGRRAGPTGSAGRQTDGICASPSSTPTASGVHFGSSLPTEPISTPCRCSGTSDRRSAAASGPGTEGTSSSRPYMNTGRTSGWSTRRGRSSAAGAGSRAG